MYSVEGLMVERWKFILVNRTLGELFMTFMTLITMC